MKDPRDNPTPIHIFDSILLAAIVLLVLLATAVILADLGFVKLPFLDIFILK
ncbi:MAG: hypothetical protein ABSG01_09110 [Anaerolineales bacterium]|jgi:hypothetical protein